MIIFTNKTLKTQLDYRIMGNQIMSMVLKDLIKNQARLKMGMKVLLL